MLLMRRVRALGVPDDIRGQVLEQHTESFSYSRSYERDTKKPRRNTIHLFGFSAREQTETNKSPLEK